MQYINELLVIYDSVSKLVTVASASMQHALFETEPQIVFVRSQSRDVRFHVAEALDAIRTSGSSNAEPDNKETYYTAYPHCECTIVAYFLSHNTRHLSPCIGSSKARCYGCRQYVRALLAAIMSESNVSQPFLRGARQISD